MEVVTSRFRPLRKLILGGLEVSEVRVILLPSSCILVVFLTSIGLEYGNTASKLGKNVNLTYYPRINPSPKKCCLHYNHPKKRDSFCNVLSPKQFIVSKPMKRKLTKRAGIEGLF